MSERGVFAIDRGAWEHDFLADDQPFSRREAWFWLVSEAAWKPHRRRIMGRPIDLARGQYVGSMRFIASKWRWSEPRVRRFLSGLVSEGMVDAKTDAGVTVLTICNYDKYQRVSLPSDAMREVDADAGATQERRKVEDMEDKERTEAIASGAPAPPAYTDSRHQLWAEGVPMLVSLGVVESTGRKMVGTWLKSTRDDAQAVLGAIQRARDARANSPIPWITNALKGSADERTGSLFAHSPAVQSGSAPVFAGVAAAAERRARERSAAGQQRQVQQGPHLAERHDPEHH